MTKPILLNILLICFCLGGCTTITETLEPQAIIEPYDLSSVQNEADEAYQNNDFTRAEELYTKLAKDIPSEKSYWFRLGNIYARTNRPDTAILAYREAVLRDPEYVNAWYNMGILQLKQSANSFNQMQQFVKEEDPLSIKGKKVLDAITDVIQGNNTNN
jgi:tetratricopeptide (TPR) repeat protein